MSRTITEMYIFFQIHMIFFIQWKTNANAPICLPLNKESHMDLERNFLFLFIYFFCVTNHNVASLHIKYEINS